MDQTSSSRSSRPSPGKSSKLKSGGLTGDRSKKERWLLTRKTWRYMTDAVGNLLPSDPNVTDKPSTSSRVISESQCCNVVSAGGAAIVGAQTTSSSVSRESSITTQLRSRGRRRSSQGVSIGTQSSSDGKIFFPSAAPSPISSTTQPSDTSIVQCERIFHETCNNQSHFLVWSRTNPPALSGPMLRQQRLEDPTRPARMATETEASAEENEDYFDDDMEGDSIDPSEYDEYDDDGEQLTVLEERKASFASSISSAITGFFQRSYVSVGVQTDPFPEETLNRLRRQCFLQETSSGSSSVVTTPTITTATIPSSANKGSKSSGGISYPDSFSSTSGYSSSASSNVAGTSVGKKLSSSVPMTTLPGGTTAESSASQSIAGPIVSSTSKTSSIQSIPASSSSSSLTHQAVSTGTPPPTSTSSTSTIYSGKETNATEQEKKLKDSYSSSSIGDTVMRYFRMVRKNSQVDKSDIDRFKTVNYDRSLRNIKSKNVTIEEALEFEKNKQAAAAAAAAAAASSKDIPTVPSSSSPVKVSSGVGTEVVGSVAGFVSAAAGPVTSDTPTRVAEAMVTSEGKSSGNKSPPVATSGPISRKGSEDEKTRKSNRILPSVGIQAGESLVRFLKLFNPRKNPKTASYCSSESPPPVDSGSTRSGSVVTTTATMATTLMSSSGSDDLVTSSCDYAYRPSQDSSARASFDTNLGEPHDEDFDDVFTFSNMAEYPEFPSFYQSFPFSRKSISSDQQVPSPPQEYQHGRAMIHGGVFHEVSSPSSSAQSVDHHPRPHEPQSFNIPIQQHYSAVYNNAASSASVSQSGRGRGLDDPRIRYNQAQQSLSGMGKSKQQQQTLTTSCSPSNLTSKTMDSSTAMFKCDIKQDSGGEPSPQGGMAYGGGSGGVGGGGVQRDTSGIAARSNQQQQLQQRQQQRVGRPGAEMMMSRDVPEKRPPGGGGGSSIANIIMQKSKSSSSVLHHPSSSSSTSSSSTPTAPYSLTTSTSGKLISKPRLFRSSKKPAIVSTTSPTSPLATSQPKSQPTWAPQHGKSGVWTSLISGRQVSLSPVQVQNLSEVELGTLQKVALTKLQSFELGVDIKIPREKSNVGTGASAASKPKRRPYLLKKKALSTGFFESKREQLGKEGSSGLVFNISLSQCVKNDRERRQQGEEYSSDPSAPPLTPSWVTDETCLRENIQRQHSNLAPRDEDGNGEENKYYGQVPELVVACVKHLETYGLHTTGIFRVSSSLKRIRQLREDIDGGKEIKLGEEHSPHDVAALLKEFLRDLPEPLLSRELYEAFLRTQKLRNRKMQLECMQYLIDLLPVANRDTLYALLGLFAKVVENCQDTRTKTGDLVIGNKMEAYSLATLIAPNILPCMPVPSTVDGGIGASAEQNAILTRERRDSIDVVNYMITNYKDLFTVSAETLNQIYTDMLETNPEAVEHILRTKFPADAEVEDLDSSSLVFEGGGYEGAIAIGGEYVDQDQPRMVVLRKREEILHKGGGKGGGGHQADSSDNRAGVARSESGRGKIDMGSREKIDAGGDSDSSSTKSTTSRWFRKSKSGAEQKNRASSDSGSDKVKPSRKKKEEVVSGSMEESKRASSLDSVNVRDMNRGMRYVETISTSASPSRDRQRSSSDQGLKIPMDMSRRQSSPLLETCTTTRTGSSGAGGGQEGGGVIRASLKIQMPLNIDDTDIPFIEEDNSSEAHPPYAHHKSADVVFLDDLGNSPVDDSSITFPYEEIEARICLGVRSAKDGGQGMSPSSSGTINTVTSHSRLSNNSKPSQSPVSTPTSTAWSGGRIGGGDVRPTPEPGLSYGSTGSIHSTGGSRSRLPKHPSSSGSSSQPSSSVESKVSGKETKSANISGIIKSKTADFEKLAKKSLGGGAPQKTQRRQSRQHQVIRSEESGSASTIVESGEGSGSSNRGKTGAIGLSRSSVDLAQGPGGTSASSSSSGPTWKRSEIIASPARKKQETFL